MLRGGSADAANGVHFPTLLSHLIKLGQDEVNDMESPHTLRNTPYVFGTLQKTLDYTSDHIVYTVLRRVYTNHCGAVRPGETIERTSACILCNVCRRRQGFSQQCTDDHRAPLHALLILC